MYIPQDVAGRRFKKLVAVTTPTRRMVPDRGSQTLDEVCGAPAGSFQKVIRARNLYFALQEHETQARIHRKLLKDLGYEGVEFPP